MQKILNLVVILLTMMLALASCSKQNMKAQNRYTTDGEVFKPMADAAELEILYDQFWQDSLKLNPIQATQVGDSRYNDQWPNNASQAQREKVEAFQREWLARLSALNPSGLEAQARLSFDILHANLSRRVASDRFPDWKMPVNQFRSVVNMAPQLGSGRGAQPFKTVKDYDNWLARANQLPLIFDTTIENMRIGLRDGVTQPKVLMQKVLPQIDSLLKGSVEENIFWMPIKNMPKEFSARDAERLNNAYRELIEVKILPAYRRMRVFIENEYLPKCRDSFSISALPDGQAWYAHLVKQHTTTDMSPEQIHNLGLSEVARIQMQMRGVMQSVGFKGELKEFFAYMTAPSEFTFANEADLLKAYNDFRARVDAGIPKLFSLTPRAGFEIRPIEAFRAASAAGGSYQGPSLDGKRAGIFYINTFDLPSRKTWDMEALYLHEAVPGHHFQIALKQELEGLPMFRRFGSETAFSEGWGLYAESLGKELGVYTDPYQYFGRLQAELWRAIRLVVDTGLHSKNWTREQVIQYMKDNSATTDTEAISETERYIAVPGQALAYKIGEQKILQLRKRAEAKLGANFDPREFHAEILKDGSLPLGVLEAKIERWLENSNIH